MLNSLPVPTLFFGFPSFFFKDTATTEIYTLSLHDALPIWCGDGDAGLHVTGTDFWPPTGLPHRHLLAGRNAARDGHREAAVRWKLLRRADLRDSAGCSTFCLRNQIRSAWRSCAHCQALSGEGSAPPHSDRARRVKRSEERR